ncbi:MAG: LytTR family transcriptional regulator [Ruminococcaceae bacterium]|nr:LytTR family transcriptional regulator [Oscillospiraceae bacterium]
MYFESFKHNFKIVTVNGSYEYRTSFSEITDQLSGSDFVRVHRSYFINYDQTRSIEYDKVIMSDGTEIPISKDKRKEMRRLFLKLGEDRS